MNDYIETVEVTEHDDSIWFDNNDIAELEFIGYSLFFIILLTLVITILKYMLVKLGWYSDRVSRVVSSVHKAIITYGNKIFGKRVNRKHKSDFDHESYSNDSFLTTINDELNDAIEEKIKEQK